MSYPNLGLTLEGFRVIPGILRPGEVKIDRITAEVFANQIAGEAWQLFPLIGARKLLFRIRFQLQTHSIFQQVGLGRLIVAPSVWTVTVDYGQQHVAGGNLEWWCWSIRRQRIFENPRRGFLIHFGEFLVLGL